MPGEDAAGARTSGPSSLSPLLLERMSTPSDLGPYRDARIVIELVDGPSWTIELRDGRLSLSPRPADDPDTTIRTTSRTLEDMLENRRSGTEAFLSGDLRVRGNLELSLRLASVFITDETPEHFPRPRDVEVDGIRVFTVEAGAGDPVILLHGLGATNSSMLPTMDALARDYRVIAPDLPGFGGSDKPIRPLHAAWFARWLTGFMDVMGIERAHLVGNSMGGRVAVDAGLRFPDRVDRIVLFAPSPAFLRERPYLWLVRILRPEMALLPMPGIPRHRVERGIRSMFHKPDRLPDGWVDSAADEFLRIYAQRRGRRAFFSAARQIYLEDPHDGRGEFWERLPQLSRPTLFIWGENDPLVPVGFAPHVEESLPSAESVVLEDCGHVPQFELPDVTHDLARRFLSGQSQSRGDGGPGRAESDESDAPPSSTV